MLITSLEQMESIVSKNKELRWDGWTVISSYPSEKGRTSKFGAIVNGSWHLQRRFELNKNGWEIPKNFVR